MLTDHKQNNNESTALPCVVRALTVLNYFEETHKLFDRS